MSNIMAANSTFSDLPWPDSFPTSPIDSQKRSPRPSISRSNSRIQRRSWNRFGGKNGSPVKRRSVSTLDMSVLDMSAPDTPGPSPQIISSLFDAIIEFWGTILAQDSWGLKSSPNSSAWLTTLKRLGLRAGPLEADNSSESTEGATGHGSEILPEILDPNSPQYKENCWTVVRWGLSEERDRLCLWKSSFGDDWEHINRLLQSNLTLCSDLGHTALEALVNIAESLLADATDPCFEQSGGLEAAASIQCDRCKRLCQMVIEAKKEVQSVLDEDTMWNSIGSLSESYTEDMSKEGCSLLDLLKNEVGRLHKLSFQMKLAFIQVTI